MRVVSPLASPKSAFSFLPHTSVVADVEGGAKEVVKISTDDNVIGKKVTIRPFD